MIYFILLANGEYNNNNFSNYVNYYHIVFTLLDCTNVWT